MAGRRRPRSPRTREVRTPIATEIYIPNHSGDHSAGIVNTTPVLDSNIVNKKYVDDQISSIDLSAYVEVAGDTMTGNLLFDPVGTPTMPTDGVVKLAGDYSTTLVGSAFGVTSNMTGGAFAAFACSPTMLSSSEAQAFRLTPSFGSNDHAAAMLLFKPDAHAIGYDDTFNIYTEELTRTFVATIADDATTVAYNGITIGGEVLILDAARPNAAFTDDMITLKGGMNRVFGANGSVTQTGLTFEGFGTKTGAIAGDTVVAMTANGGTFEHKYDYSASNMLQFGAGLDSSMGYDGDDLIINSNDVGTGAVLLNSLPYGEIYMDNNTTNTVLAAQDTYYQVTTFNNNGISHRATPDHTNDHITIAVSGAYKVDLAISAQAARAHTYYFEVHKNNGATGFSNLEAERQTGVANKPGSVALTGMIDLTAGDTVELWVKRTTGGAVSQSILVTHANMNLFRIGE